MYDFLEVNSGLVDSVYCCVTECTIFLLLVSRHTLLISFLHKHNLTFASFMSDIPLHIRFFFVAYNCVREGWGEEEMTTEGVYLHDRPTFQDVILKSRQQTDWQSGSLRVRVLRIVGKLLHLLNCTGEQFIWLNCTGKLFTLLNCTGEQFIWHKCAGKLFILLKCAGNQFIWLKCTGKQFILLKCTGKLLSFPKYEKETHFVEIYGKRQFILLKCMGQRCSLM